MCRTSFLGADHKDGKESDGQADDVELHDDPKDPDATAAGDDHVVANTCLLSG